MCPEEVPVSMVGGMRIWLGALQQAVQRGKHTQSDELGIYNPKPRPVGQKKHMALKN